MLSEEKVRQLLEKHEATLQSWENYKEKGIYRDVQIALSSTRVQLLQQILEEKK